MGFSIVVNCATITTNCRAFYDSKMKPCAHFPSLLALDDH
jgi:hypothetical protein